MKHSRLLLLLILGEGLGDAVLWHARRDAVVQQQHIVRVQAAQHEAGVEVRLVRASLWPAHQRATAANCQSPSESLSEELTQGLEGDENLQIAHRVGHVYILEAGAADARVESAFICPAPARPSQDS